MHTSIRRYDVEASQMDELMRRIDKGFARHIAVRPGFATYEAIDLGAELMTISAFVESEEADASRQLARDWVASALADLSVEVTDVLHGEIVVNRAARDAVHPAHADTSHEVADVRRIEVRGDVDVALRVIDRDLAGTLAEMPGVLSFRAVNCEGQIVLVCLSEDPDRAAPAEGLISGFLSDADAGATLSERERHRGALRVSRTRMRMLQEAHA